ncbi:hypothetical protein SERLADRAFT_446852 [Serpula lacrymans var. lacrymans S7.9]|uniref:LNS2/PITP domain-containing protein n=1 Tax=Serpula lacrymans var. lacrymans (strain S7.9) TaxID=578457 RepID=F8NNU2_SERL9|nr:uncharacterized protein SERLADRAFT_446852 [Serpula lacrymans var. lacrymans S7.9]EGO27614.1 hypothetical protein SERLADRAFT_446852 [Serpula lacrymans var. lacrymans S7.9]
MNYIRGAVNAISAPYQYYKDLPPINPSTLTGAIDVIVIKRPLDDGDIELACSPFHVRFGKLQVLRPAEKKVNVSVNGHPIPFDMKIGDAGEAFFVFETEGEIPDDLVTSPILAATRSPEAKDVSVPIDNFGAKQHEDSITKTEEKEDMQEPEFLDLNATATTKDTNELSLSKPPLPSPPATPPPVAAETSSLLSSTGTQMNPLGEVDNALRVSDSEVHPPDVLYQSDMALDMSGYHSHGREASDRTVTSESTRSPSPEHSPFSPSVRPKSISLLKTAFPVQRATSEPPPDFDEQRGVVDPDHTPVQEYSWEWGGFPQPSPLRTAFPKASRLDHKGKNKAALDLVLPSYLEEELSTKDDSSIIRSHSVPLEVDGSPRTIRPELSTVDDRDGEGPGPGGFGSGGRLTAIREDPTKFQVWIEGKVIEFELSIVESDQRGSKVFDGGDEVEAARLFDSGKIDYSRLLRDDTVVRDDKLVIKWVGGQFITRSDGSPLMEALCLWRDAALQDYYTDPPALPTPQPSPTYEEEPFSSSSSSDEEQKMASPKSVELSRKPTSSSWVRWWSRSRDKDEELKSQRSRPVLRGSTSVPLNAAVKSSSMPKPRTHAPSVSAPAITPPPGQALQPSGSDLEAALRVKIVESRRKYAKTLRLSSDQLKSLDLKSGANTITFSLSTTGVPVCTARIFVWDSTDHVVVSDIDGTITKSDGLGHIFTMIGRDWTHLGVAKLYTDITRNGYKIMYLTSRAIGQADSTRDYLKGIKQNDYQLPEGPVIMSPDRLMASLHREVIMRKPEVFKMACLRDIQRLFGDASRSPFYAGFGNRITDALSYRSVNIPSARIFTIDSSGEVKMELLELAGYKSSYIHMTDLVDQMFPPINRKWTPEFTDFNYWKIPVQEFALPDLTPPSPALSARSDTSNQSTLARIRNFSLVGSRQSNNMKQFALPPPTTEMVRRDRDNRSSHLRQMSSLERLSSTFAAFTQSSPVDESGMSASPASRSSSSTFLDSGSEDGAEDGEDGAFKPRTRARSRSITSMPGSLDDMHFGLDDDDDDDDVNGDVEEGYGYDGGEEGPENEEEAAEEAFDEDFFATGEMKHVPFL